LSDSKSSTRVSCRGRFAPELGSGITVRFDAEPGHVAAAGPEQELLLAAVAEPELLLGAIAEPELLLAAGAEPELLLGQCAEPELLLAAAVGLGLLEGFGAAIELDDVEARVGLDASPGLLMFASLCLSNRRDDCVASSKKDKWLLMASSTNLVSA
jgi:hypothetical protein